MIATETTTFLATENTELTEVFTFLTTEFTDPKGVSLRLKDTETLKLLNEE